MNESAYSQAIELIDAELKRSTKKSGVPLRASDPVRLDRTMRIFRDGAPKATPKRKVQRYAPTTGDAA